MPRKGNFWNPVRETGLFPEGPCWNLEDLPRNPAIAPRCMSFLTIFGEKPAFSWTAPIKPRPSSLKKALS